jgi:hypothetical protein
MVRESWVWAARERTKLAGSAVRLRQPARSASRTSGRRRLLPAGASHTRRRTLDQSSPRPPYRTCPHTIVLGPRQLACRTPWSSSTTISYRCGRTTRTPVRPRVRCRAIGRRAGDRGAEPGGHRAPTDHRPGRHRGNRSGTHADRLPGSALGAEAALGPLPCPSAQSSCSSSDAARTDCRSHPSISSNAVGGGVIRRSIGTP